jgi:hypothetical protein
MSTHPTQAQIHVVQKVPYNHTRIAELKDLRQQLALTMNFNQTTPLLPGDIRNPAGSGPNWSYASSGQVDMLVVDGAALCDQVAQAILQMRADVGVVHFPASDKHQLMNAMREEAASWSARGRAWRAPGTPDVQARVAEISKHVTNSLQEAAHVQHYFKAHDQVLG